MHHEAATGGDVPKAVDVVSVTLNAAIDQTVTIPDFDVGKVNRVQASRSDPGGKGVNVASFLTDFGHTVAVTGFLGRENTAIFEGMFADRGIDDYFLRIAGQTRVGVKIADPLRHETTDINFPGPAPTPDDLAALFRRMESLRAAWFALAGSIPPGVAPTVYRDLIKTVKAHGGKVALDTSGPPLSHALDAAPDIVKPNIQELEEYCGEPLSDRQAVVKAAQALLVRGIGLVVVSMGADGALFVSEETALVARPPHITVQSTVGAGDAMVSGLIAARLRGLSLAQCARLATAFSLEAISHLGHRLSSVAAVEAFMAQVSIDENLT